MIGLAGRWELLSEKPTWSPEHKGPGQIIEATPIRSPGPSPDAVEGLIFRIRPMRTDLPFKFSLLLHEELGLFLRQAENGIVQRLIAFEIA